MAIGFRGVLLFGAGGGGFAAHAVGAGISGLILVATVGVPMLAGLSDWVVSRSRRAVTLGRSAGPSAYNCALPHGDFLPWHQDLARHAQLDT